MKDEDKTKEQLIDELAELRQRVSEFERKETRRKELKEVLQKKKDELQTILDSSPLMIWCKDKDGNTLFANRYAAKTFGYSVDDLLNKSCYDFHPKEEAEKFRRDDMQVINSGKPAYGIIEKYTVPSGEQRWALTNKMPYHDEEGNVVGVVIFVMDITDHKREEETLLKMHKQMEMSLNDLTSKMISANEKLRYEIRERKRSEEALRQGEEEYRTLVENVNIGVYRNTCGPHGRFLQANPAIAKIFGYDSIEELMEISVSDLYQNPEERKLFVEEATQRGFVRDKELRLRKKDGALIWGSCTAKMQFDESGNAKWLDGVIEDVTERKRAEEGLKKSRELLRDLNRRLEFIREEERKKISLEMHDELGQTLTALRLDLSWLSKRVPKEQLSVVEKIEEMANSIREMIHSVQRISSELRPVVLDDLGFMAAMEWQADKFHKKTGIKCNIGSHSEEIVLDLDLSIAFFRILQECLTNIARHANATEVSVEFKEKDGAVILRVSDNGRGITDEQIADPKSLGLMGMRERLYPLAGRLNIEGVKGKGTVVTVSIAVKRRLDVYSLLE